jgi:protein phosphatase
MQDSGFDNPSLRPVMSSGDVERQRLAPSIEIQTKSVASDKHPDRNEDALFELPEKRAVGIFDGMGGHAAGDKASRIARDRVDKSISLIQEGLSLPQAEARMKEILIEANAAVYQQARTENNDMGTTASVVYVWEGARGERKAIIGNVGDSRVYLLRGGRLEQITLDDNRVRSAMSNEQAARQLQSKLNNIVDPQRQLSDNERALFNLRNQISQALGLQSVEPRVHSIDLQPADRLIVCSDGISDNLTDNKILAILNANQNNAEAVQKVIAASQARSRSNHARAKADDMTVAIIGETSASPAIPTRKVEQPPETQGGQKSLLQKGSPVRVQRSSGMIEAGWTVESFDSRTGYVTVIKPEGNHYLTKQIPRAELEKLNRPATIQDIPSADNLQQLVDILQQIGGIQGSQHLYNSAELLQIVDDVVAGRESLGKLTRTGGLRQKVADLIKLAEVRKKI